MSLDQKLAEVRARAEARIPPEKGAIMHRATDDLRRSGIMEKIIQVGATAPAFELSNHDGRRVASADLLPAGPMMLSFFRGSW